MGNKKITKKEYEDALIVVENYLNQIQGETYSNEAKDNLKKHAALMGISKNSILIDVGSVRLLNILKINEHTISLKPKAYELGEIIHSILEDYYKDFTEHNFEKIEDLFNKYKSSNPFLILDLEIWKKKLYTFYLYDKHHLQVIKLHFHLCSR